MLTLVLGDELQRSDSRCNGDNIHARQSDACITTPTITNQYKMLQITHEEGLYVGDAMIRDGTHDNMSYNKWWPFTFHVTEATISGIG